MRALIFALLLAHLPSTALAQSVRLGDDTVSIGESVQTLMKVAGKPDRVRPFPGSPSFALYEYSPDGRQVNVSVKNGKVTGIADNTIVSKPGSAVLKGVELNGSTIVTGDTLAKLLQSAGKPDRIRSFADAPEMSVYEYLSNGRQVSVTVRNGGQRHLGDTGDPEIAAQSDPHCYCDRGTPRLRAWQRHALPGG